MLTPGEVVEVWAGLGSEEWMAGRRQVGDSHHPEPCVLEDVALGISHWGGLASNPVIQQGLARYKA